MTTKTSNFGTSSREGHDSTDYYKRNMSTSFLDIVQLNSKSSHLTRAERIIPDHNDSWKNKIYNHSSEDMFEIPNNKIGVAFTSPPYNVGKDYDEDLSVEEYMELIHNVGREVYRVLKPGGRYIINIANLGRRPYIPLHAFFYQVHISLGFIPSGEIIWKKGNGANGSCAWGSWQSSKSPCIRDIHEYLLVFNKERVGRPDKGTSDISKEEFMKATLSIWDILPESAKRVGHPAPFPVDLCKRVIKLYSYQEDTILDPFAGAGSCPVAAKQLGRYYVGYDIVKEYCEIAKKRLGDVEWPPRKQSVQS